MNSTLLIQLTITTINESYSEPECMRVYTDGSTIGMHGLAGAGVYCQEFILGCSG